MAQPSKYEAYFKPPSQSVPKDEPTVRNMTNTPSDDDPMTTEEDMENALQVHCAAAGGKSATR